MILLIHGNHESFSRFQHLSPSVWLLGRGYYGVIDLSSIVLDSPPFLCQSLTSFPIGCETESFCRELEDFPLPLCFSS
ncbi:MAG: hypothetical protein AYK19_13700 [Theionarchaea archaeon DG-70-1]|nr:MAG: hypothetical protein AYK19_13700 [Theionarchaea archaeon DG-70-1]